jgi:mono/diheme cytochrome c family protein
MPEFRFDADEVLDVMAYLKSVAGPAPATVVRWPAWAAKAFDDLEDDEFEAVDALTERGKGVWGVARCSICHVVNGPQGLIGGFVDLRSGGADLQAAASKLKRDWIYRWLKDPRAYFPETLMPRFTLSDDDILALVEYILRDGAFTPPEPEEDDAPEPPKQDWSALDDLQRVERGKQLITRSRCVVCHEVPGIAEVLPKPAPFTPPPKDTFAYIAWDRRCLTCHAIDGRGGTYAPDLSTEGSRLHADWIAQFVVRPDMLRPLSQQMPKLNLTEREGKVIGEHMRTKRLDPEAPEAIPGGPVTAAEVQRGAAAYKALGCVACHTVGEGPGGVVGPDLALVADRMRPGYLWYHLKHPHAFNRANPEPDYGFTDDEARDLAAYLSTKKKKAR